MKIRFFRGAFRRRSRLSKTYSWARGWIQSHCFGLLLCALPMVAIFANYSCTEITQGPQERDFFMQVWIYFFYKFRVLYTHVTYDLQEAMESSAFPDKIKINLMPLRKFYKLLYIFNITKIFAKPQQYECLYLHWKHQEKTLFHFDFDCLGWMGWIGWFEWSGSKFVYVTWRRSKTWPAAAGKKGKRKTLLWPYTISLIVQGHTQGYLGMPAGQARSVKLGI